MAVAVADVYFLEICGISTVIPVKAFASRYSVYVNDSNNNGGIWNLGEINI